MIALLTNDKVVFGIVAGLPFAVAILALMWARPRRWAPLWGLASILVIGLAVVGVWAALRGRPSEASAGGASAGGKPSPAATCAPSGAALRISARGIAFDTTCLAAPANTKFTIAFTNQDAAIGHSIHILTASPAVDPNAKSLFQGQVITGPASVTYDVNAVPAGTYYFHCDVHPNQLFGAFVVK